MEAIQVIHHGAGVWTHLMLKPVRIGLLIAVAVLGADFVLI